MPWFRSEAWREIMTLADQWRGEAAEYIDDPGPQAGRKLGVVTYDLIRLVDANRAGIDPTPLWDTAMLIQGHRGRLPSAGNPVRIDEIRAAMLRAVGVLERLRFLGVANQEPQLDEPSGEIESYVTLAQAAAIVNRSKSALEKLRAKMPLPAVEGGGGRAAEWKWSIIRPFLELQFHRQLPPKFPGDRSIKR